MAENKGSPGLSKLARVISQRAENVAGKAERDLVLDFGSIKGDMSLLTNTFPIPIPRSDYHVCRLCRFQRGRYCNQKLDQANSKIMMLELQLKKHTDSESAETLYVSSRQTEESVSVNF